MSYEFTIPVTTEGTEENPFQYTKNTIKETAKKAVSKLKWGKQKNGVTLLSKIEDATETDNTITLTEGEKEVLSIIADMYILSKGTEFIFEVPELHQEIETLRENMSLNSIKSDIEALKYEEKKELKKWINNL